MAMAASEHEQRSGRIEGLGQCRPPWSKDIPSVRSPAIPVSAFQSLKREHVSSNLISFQGTGRLGSQASVLPTNLGRPAMFKSAEVTTRLVTCRSHPRHVPKCQDFRATRLALPCSCCYEGYAIIFADRLRWNAQRRGRSPEIIHHHFDTGCRNSRCLAAAVREEV